MPYDTRDPQSWSNKIILLNWIVFRILQFPLPAQYLILEMPLTLPMKLPASIWPDSPLLLVRFLSLNCQNMIGNPVCLPLPWECTFSVSILPRRLSILLFATFSNIDMWPRPRLWEGPFSGRFGVEEQSVGCSRGKNQAKRSTQALPMYDLLPVRAKHPSLEPT